MKFMVIERAHNRTRFFYGTSTQFNREWDRFGADRSDAMALTKAEAAAKAGELNERHAEHSTWCRYGVERITDNQ
jgi:hypothetical protein